MGAWAAFVPRFKGLVVCSGDLTSLSPGTKKRRGPLKKTNSAFLCVLGASLRYSINVTIV